MKVIDLFCGMGGFSEGFRQAGHEIVLAVDNWEPALQVHNANHTETLHWNMDISELQFKDLPEADILIGGPPCQVFSYMGKELGEDDPRGKLGYDFMRLAKKFKYVLFENVPGIRNYPIFPKLLSGLGGQDCKLCYADFGVPTIRKRIFISNFGFPNPTHFNPNIKWKVSTNKPTLEWLGAREHLAMDDDWFFVRRHTKGRNGPPVKSAELPTFTILSGYQHDLMIARTMTPRELMSLSGFPENYKLFGSAADQTKMIANAVSPVVAKAFGELLN